MDVFKGVLDRINGLKEIMELSDDEIKVLSNPVKVSKTILKVDNQEIPAWRVLYNRALGPGKGGIRFHEDVTESEVKSLAFWMSLKNSLVGLPYGGGKGGVKFNPKEHDPDFIQKVSRAYIDHFYKVLGENIDVPAPDVYTNSQVMAWMLDEYEQKIGEHQPAMITGKPLELGGCSLRNDATARGGYIVAKEFLKHYCEDTSDLTVAIQGFGNAGSNIAKMLSSDGFKVIAVSDSKGGIFQKDGLNIPNLIELKNEGKSVIDYSQGKFISNDQLLELDVDILILAALENQITSQNAQKISAKYIIELANGPIDHAADKILWSKKILVVPDILANAGGVVVSYFEWAQNKAGNILSEDYLEKKLLDIMEGSFKRVYELFKDREEIDLRTSAYILAIERILKAERLRGRLA